MRYVKALWINFPHLVMPGGHWTRTGKFWWRKSSKQGSRGQEGRQIWAARGRWTAGKQYEEKDRWAGEMPECVHRGGVERSGRGKKDKGRCQPSLGRWQECTTCLQIQGEWNLTRQQKLRTAPGFPCWLADPGYYWTFLNNRTGDEVVPSLEIQSFHPLFNWNARSFTIHKVWGQHHTD